MNDMTHSAELSTPSKYAISEWPDTDALYRRFDTLVNQPMRPIRADAMERVRGWFDQHCNGSRKLFDEASRVIPGGVQHNLAFNYPFPLAIAKAQGAYLTDVDGNRYIDFLQAGGPTLLGSNHAEVREKVRQSCATAGRSPASCTNTKSSWRNWFARRCRRLKCCACWARAPKR